MSKLPKDRKYHISFNTKNVPGKIEAVSVTLGVDIAGEEAVFHVNLADDPSIQRFAPIASPTNRVATGNEPPLASPRPRRRPCRSCHRQG